MIGYRVAHSKYGIYRIKYDETVLMATTQHKWAWYF